jgi:probable rRNA maturation factor
MSEDGSSLVLFRPLPAKIRLSAEEKSTVRAFTRTLSECVVGRRPFTCLITNDAELQTLNQKFLGHDYPTDVLSFPAGNGSRELGEIAISAERAEAQARSLGHDRADEIRILMLHGVLHLTGLDHERDRGQMAAAEQKWRAEFGLPVTLIARAARKRAEQLRS